MKARINSVFHVGEYKEMRCGFGEGLAPPEPHRTNSDNKGRTINLNYRLDGILRGSALS